MYSNINIILKSILGGKISKWITLLLTIKESHRDTRIEGEGKNIEDVSKWFHETLKHVFVKPKETVIFKGYSWYLIKE